MSRKSKQEQADRDSMAVRNGIHPDTEDMVEEFAHALLKKLRAAEKKYGYSNKWLFADWESECRSELMRHIEKGDPLDVAAYCAFMWKRRWATTPVAGIAETCRACGLVKPCDENCPNYIEVHQ